MAMSKGQRKKVYNSLKGKFKGKKGREALKKKAKSAYRNGEKKLSRGLWAEHTKRSAYAAGFKAASKRKSSTKKRRS